MNEKIKAFLKTKKGIVLSMLMPIMILIISLSSDSSFVYFGGIIYFIVAMINKSVRLYDKLKTDD